MAAIDDGSSIGGETSPRTGSASKSGGVRIRRGAPGSPFRDNPDAVQQHVLAVEVLQQNAKLAFALDALSPTARCEMVATD
jgi:hypothetical protein